MTSYKSKIQIKRVYDKPHRNDGYRVLVDRLWPRGVKKDDAKVDLWAKEIAPSSELRQWFNHDSAKFSEFRTRYQKELDANEEAILQLSTSAASQTMTLLYAARDETNNNAVVLLDYLLERTSSQSGSRHRWPLKIG